MRYPVIILSGLAALAAWSIAPRRAIAAPLVLAQAEGGGLGGSIGGSLESSGARTVQARPRVRRPSAPAPRVVIERRVMQQPRSVERRSANRGGGVAVFDGVWAIAIGGACASAGTGQVTISSGLVYGKDGVPGGRVGPDGAVSTVTSYNGLTVRAQGRLSGGSGAGFYQQSDGCSGPWSGAKL